jgi:putative colanic acid biosynthesis UDP-glucose lipid carrier transferase
MTTTAIGNAPTAPGAHTAPIAEPVARSLSRTVALDIVALLDVAAVAAGAAIPSWIYAHFGDVTVEWAVVARAALIAGFIAHLLLRNAGLYDTARTHDLPNPPLKLLLALLVAVGCVVGLGLPLAHLKWHVMLWYALWISASFTAILLTRGISHAVLARLTAAGRFERRVAVFGAGTIARRVHDHITSGSTGIRFCGLYDDRLGDERVDSDGLAIDGKLDDLITAAQAEHIDEIVIALPQTADGRIAGIVKSLDRAPCSVHIVTHIASDYIDARRALRVSSIGGVGLLDVKARPLADWALPVKRAEDIVIASIGLLFALPILAVAIAAIKLESPGPAFYRQRRRGLNGRIIDVLKLRTLKVTEADGEVRQVTPGDNRVTRSGAFLRRSSIDELPQLWNVLKGEMSIVGPRPHALVHDQQFSSMLEDYSNRHQVKPGITGLAQVEGFRGQTETREQIEGRVAQDIAYIKSWSLWLDLQIILRTLAIVISGKNAH